MSEHYRRGGAEQGCGIMLLLALAASLLMIGFALGRALG